MAKVFKRDTSPYFYAWLSDPRVPDGVVKRSTKQTTKTAAIRVANQLQVDLDNEIEAQEAAQLDACGLTWLDAVKLFLEQGDVKASTVSGYANIAGVVTEILGDFDLGQLTHAKLKEFCLKRRQTEVIPYKAAPTGRRVSDQTIRNNLSMISSVYKLVMDLGVLNAPSVNPLKTFDRSFLKTSKKVDRHLRPSQFQEALDSLSNPTHRAMLIALVGSGLRTSELINLYWGEIDFVRNVIEFGNIDPDRSKNSRSRRIPLLPIVAATLIVHRTDQTKAGEHDPRGLVFPTFGRDAEGKKQARKRYDLKYLIKAIRARTRLKTYRNHGLRHSFASWSLQQGLDADAIRRALGHTTFSTTSRYAHHVDDSMVAQFRKMELPVTAQNTAQTSGFSEEANFNEGEKSIKTDS